MTKSIKREEYSYNHRRVVLSTIELSPGRYETMLLRWSDGEGIAEAHATTEAEALEQFQKIRAAHIPDNERAAAGPVVLTGKYAKLRDDLRRAAKIGEEAAALVDDGGTCNFDAPALSLPRWRAALVEQAAKEAGGFATDWTLFRSKHYVFHFRNIPGQAYKREKAAEAMTAYLASRGYNERVQNHFREWRLSLYPDERHPGGGRSVLPWPSVQRRNRQ